MILDIILNIAEKEKINLSLEDINKIVINSNNNINNTIWMLEMKKFNVVIKSNWTDLLNKIVDIIISKKQLVENHLTKDLSEVIKSLREILYILFITNIDFHLVISKLMLLFIEKIDCIKLRYMIIETTSTFEFRVSQGTRHIIHMEAYLIKIIQLLNTNNSMQIISPD